MISRVGCPSELFLVHSHPCHLGRAASRMRGDLDHRERSTDGTSRPAEIAGYDA